MFLVGLWGCDCLTGATRSVPAPPLLACQTFSLTRHENINRFCRMEKKLFLEFREGESKMC